MFSFFKVTHLVRPDIGLYLTFSRDIPVLASYRRKRSSLHAKPGVHQWYVILGEAAGRNVFTLAVSMIQTQVTAQRVLSVSM